MHPLEKQIDEAPERKAPARRRSSLDCTASLDDERNRARLGDDEVDKRGARRLSLGNGKVVAATFLATSTRRIQDDLDDELHASTHVAGDLLLAASRRSVTTNPSTTYDDEGSMSSSFDDDADSFCDAETEEKANKEYLRKDLGASFYFTDNSGDEYETIRDRISDDGFGVISEDEPEEHALPQTTMAAAVSPRARHAGRRAASSSKSPTTSKDSLN